jgi:murein L,D-transpeptidase YcbB/YkuD
VFHPYWNVPNSIKREEILPYLKNSGGGGWFSASTRPRILQAHNLYVQYRGRNVDASTINWRTADVRSYRFYQPPGGKNVLGFVKFMFPNKHSVYMHDTPTKSLFTQTKRAYSHGCIRVRNPRKLAEVILARDRGWSSGNVGSAIQSGKNQHVNLKRHLPVHISYFTARVEKNGRVTYFSDLYGHDSRMISAMKL